MDKWEWYEPIPAWAKVLLFIGALAVMFGIYGLNGYLNGPYADNLWRF